MDKKKRQTEGERLDQKKRDARKRADAEREKEAHDPSEYQKKVILANVAAIGKDLEAITKGGLEDKTTLIRREVMRFLLFFKRRCEQERNRIVGMACEENLRNLWGLNQREKAVSGDSPQSADEEKDNGTA